jgi:hypothetical protein
MIRAVSNNNHPAMNTLYQLAGRVTGSFLPAEPNPYFFINDIPDDLPVEHNCELVASVISNLLTTVFVHTRNNNVRLSAKRYGYILVFEIHKTGHVNKETLNGNLMQLQMMAEKIGGCISITDHPLNGTIISFSFPNLPIAS